MSTKDVRLFRRAGKGGGGCVVSTKDVRLFPPFQIYRLRDVLETRAPQVDCNNSPLCRDPGSNGGPSDLQSDALPTELSRLLHPQPLR